MPTERAAAAAADAGAESIGDGGSTGEDGGASASGDAGASASDAGSSDAGGSALDAGTGTAPDAGTPALGCGAVIACESGCGASGSPCLAQCVASGTAAAQQLAQALQTCLGAVCPTTAVGVCASQTTACQMCEGGALSNGCSVLYAACERDSSGGGLDAGIAPADAGPETWDAGMSPVSDGGLGPSDAGEAVADGGTSTGDAGRSSSDAGAASADTGPPSGNDSCFDITLCSLGCGTPACIERCVGYATPAAQQDYTALQSCIEMVCPKTGGGICDSTSPTYDSTNCNNCVGDAESFGHPCYAQQDACAPVPCMQTSSCAAMSQSPVCNTSFGVCVQCLQPADCPSGSSCVDYICQPADLGCVAIYQCTFACLDATCTQSCEAAGVPAAQVDYTGLINCQDAACPPSNGGVCDTTATGYNATSCDDCIGMAQNGPCLPQIEACIASCGTNVDCAMTPATPACDTVTSTCVECAQPSDGPTDWICASNVCIRTCGSTAECPADQVCSGGICVSG